MPQLAVDTVLYFHIQTLITAIPEMVVAWQHTLAAAQLVVHDTAKVVAA
jgi:hypothetical protein